LVIVNLAAALGLVALVVGSLAVALIK